MLVKPLTAAERRAVLGAYADAYDEAAEARVVELCHLATTRPGPISGTPAGPVSSHMPGPPRSRK